MDPKQALLDCLRAVIAGDKATAEEAWRAYRQCRIAGGFEPRFSPDELAEELSNYF